MNAHICEAASVASARSTSQICLHRSLKFACSGFVCRNGLLAHVRDVKHVDRGCASQITGRVATTWPSLRRRDSFRTDWRFLCDSLCFPEEGLRSSAAIIFVSLRATEKLIEL